MGRAVLRAFLLIVGIYMLAAYAGFAYRQVWLIEWHGRALGVVGAVLLGGFVYSLERDRG